MKSTPTCLEKKQDNLYAELIHCSRLSGEWKQELKLYLEKKRRASRVSN